MYKMMFEEKETFSGWDFSYLEKFKRMDEFPLTWNYTLRIKPYMLNAKSMLDMGTGGGEYLSQLKPLPRYTCATEGYEPNVEIAKRRLQPLGVNVLKITDDCNLPFVDQQFDLIINRHESYDAYEVYRVLNEEGTFITQQVGGLNDCELNLWLLEPSPYPNWNLQVGVKKLEEAGFSIIDQKEDITRTRFYDLAAIVYYLKAIPWQVPNFSVETHAQGLARIQKMIDEQGYVDVTNHRFLIIAKK